MEKPRILVVDDSLAVRKAIGTRLQEMGAQVYEAEDGATALSLALETTPRVVVTDLWMPGMSGLQLCRLLRAEKVATDVVLLTGSEDARSRFWATQSGATAFFAKNELGPMLDRVMTLVHSPVRRTNQRSTTSSGTAQERLCFLLDKELCTSVISGEVRALAHTGETFAELFCGLNLLAIQLLRYRYLALEIGGERFLHVDPFARAEACAAAGFGRDAVRVVEDARLAGTSPHVEQLPVRFGDSTLGTLTAGGFFSDADREILRLVARELGGPARMVSLVAESRRHASTDALTSLMNRRAFTDAMARELALFARHGTPLSLLMLDIDHFKKVNDSFGHAAGDDVLKAVGMLLRSTSRRADVVARWGGEEFVIALPTTPAAGAPVMAERIRLGARMLKGRTPISVSIGCTTAIAGDTLESMTARADAALYRAKQHGRDRVETG